MILGIDCGLKTLSYALIKKNGLKKNELIASGSMCFIEKNLKKSLTMNDKLLIHEKIYKFIIETMPLNELEIVKIEQQPNNNYKMKFIETLLLITFNSLKIINGYNYQIKIVHAYSKIKDLKKKLTGKKNYYQRKKLAIEYVNQLIENEAIVCNKKIDNHNVADAILIAYV